MERRSRDAARAREGAHADGRRAGARAPRAAVAPGREGVPPRDGRWPTHAGRAVRRPRPAARLSLHVRAQLPGRLPDVHVDGRRRQRTDPAPERARRDDALRLPGAAREAAGIQAPDGLVLPVGLRARERLQLRPRLLAHGRGDARGDRADAGGRNAAGRGAQRERVGDGRHRLPYGRPRVHGVRARRRRRLPDLLDHGARARVPDGLLRHPRPRAEGPRRGRPAPDLDPAPRRVRVARAVRLLHRIEAIGADPRDDDDLRARKALLVLISVLILPVAAVWGTLYLAFGSPVGVVPFVYFGVLLGALVVFSRTRDFPWFLRVGQVDILLAPTLSMIPIGGFVTAGGVGLWGILAPLGALVFSEVRSAARWYVAWLIVFLGSGIAGELVGP